MGVGRPNTPTRSQTQIAGALTSLKNATAIGVGTAYDLGGAYRFFTVQGVTIRATTASPATATLKLQGSLNGTNWHTLAASANATTSGAMWNSTASHAVTWVRLNSTAKSAGAGTLNLSGTIGVANG